MKEFMLLVRNESDRFNGSTAEKDKAFLEACMIYINELKKGGNLISAQPMVREGKMVSGSADAFKEGPFSESREVIVGYYHVLAKDLDEAVSIAKRNPEFVYTKTARVEVRPIKMKEQATNYVYPTKT